MEIRADSSRGGALLLLWVILIVDSGTVLALNSDGRVLLELKKAILRDPNNTLGDWNETDLGPCEWTGIACRRSRVISINLYFKDLSGSLPGSLGRIRTLEKLTLAQNSLAGPIPGALLTLKALKYLDLHENYFSGSISRAAGISHLQNLEYVDLGGNLLTGTIPRISPNQTKLRFVNMGSNNFSVQRFPYSHSSIRGLRFLELSYCNLAGEVPGWVGNLTRLEQLYLFGNRLTSLPASLGRMQSLKVLDLSDNEIRGTIPPELGDLPNVFVLRLYGNFLHGTIPRELARTASSLRNLDLGINNLTGPIPPELGNLTLLQLFHVQTNKLRGPIPKLLFLNMSSLINVYLYQNAFTGTLPRDLGVAQPLAIFDCSYNAFRGPIPPNLCWGRELQRLILMNNRFSGSIPRTLLADCPSLRRLRLSNNRLTGPIPASFGASQSVVFVDLLNNSLAGSIPAELANCSSLRSLRVSGNRLTGPVPPELRNLLELQAARNALTGRLESRLCSGGLAALDLSANRLSGALPRDLIVCRSLTTLYLQNNALSGPIPPALAAMKELQVVNLSHNKLSGSIPSEIASSATLQKLDVSHNELQGPVNVSGFMGTLNSSDFEGNAGLCQVEQLPQLIALCPGVHPPREDSSPLEGSYLSLVIIASAVVVFVGSVTLGLGVVKWSKGRRPKRERWTMIVFFDQQKVDLTLKHILGALAEENVVGSGGAGTVYKGRSGDSKGFEPRGKVCEFVVKKLREPTGEFDHGFRAEMQTLGNARHLNVVRLLACCSRGDSRLLVYEYMANGSLRSVLHEGQKGLDWETRLRIALHAAQGLKYLHSDCVPPILHRDVTSGNILLDEQMNARLGDFGLALLVDPARQPTVVAGSRGYIAPECGFASVSDKADVYSYGVVLLELVTGKQALTNSEDGDEHITGWVRGRVVEGGPVGALDPKLVASGSPQKEMTLVLKIALFCTDGRPENRPRMEDVVRMLTQVRPGSEDTPQGSCSKTRDLLVNDFERLRRSRTSRQLHNSV